MCLRAICTRENTAKSETLFGPGCLSLMFLVPVGLWKFCHRDDGVEGPYILDDGLKSSRVARHKDGHENGDGDVAAEFEDLQKCCAILCRTFASGDGQQALQPRRRPPDQHVIWILRTSRAPYLAMPACSLICWKGNVTNDYTYSAVEALLRHHDPCCRSSALQERPFLTARLQHELS